MSLHFLFSFVTHFLYMPQSIQHIISDLETRLEGRKNPIRAISMAKYMKDQFVYFGMEAAVRREVQRAWTPQLKSLTDRSFRWELMHALWEKEEREFQYAAMDWLLSWPKAWISEKDGEELKWFIAQKSWWDTVDLLASNYVGKWALAYPELARETFEEWRYEDSFWLQRACLIYQLKFKDKVDISYLEELIQQMLPNKEFFIQKAIGWSLRQLSKTNPDAVKHILKKHPIQGLALREAKKYL